MAQKKPAPLPTKATKPATTTTPKPAAAKAAPLTLEQQVAYYDDTIQRLSAGMRDLATQQHEIEQQIDAVQAEAARVLHERLTAAQEIGRHHQRCQELAQELTTARTAASLYGDTGPLADQARARIEAMEREQAQREAQITAWNARAETRAAQQQAQDTATSAQLQPLHVQLAQIHTTRQQVEEARQHATEMKRQTLMQQVTQLVTDAEQKAAATKAAHDAAAERVQAARHRATALLTQHADTPDLRALAEQLGPKRKDARSPYEALLDGFEAWLGVLASMEGAINPDGEIPGSHSRTILDIITLSQGELRTLLGAGAPSATTWAGRRQQSGMSDDERYAAALREQRQAFQHRQNELDSIRVMWRSRLSYALPLAMRPWLDPNSITSGSENRL